MQNIIFNKYRPKESDNIFILPTNRPYFFAVLPVEQKVKACVRYFLKINYTSDLITYMKLQLQTMSTCVRTPRKLKLYVAIADASLHLLLQVKRGQ